MPLIRRHADPRAPARQHPLLLPFTVLAVMACKPAPPARAPPITTTLPAAPPIPTPPPDRDNDGVPDPDDRCPDEPEDRDHFEDSDGCVDRDNDGDGILDAHEWKDGRWTNCDFRYEPGGDLDCRDQPEDLDGVADDDGCPDVLCLDSCDARLSERLHFDQRGQLAADSETLLANIAAIMQSAPDLDLWVDAHTDARGNSPAAKRLTDRISADVIAALVRRGVAHDRLEPRGFGDQVPLLDNRRADGRAANRRVEFMPKFIDGCCRGIPREPDPNRPHPGECR